jgi:hypothetical protein
VRRTEGRTGLHEGAHRTAGGKTASGNHDVRAIRHKTGRRSARQLYVTMGLSSGKITVFSHRWRGFTLNLPSRAIAKLLTRTGTSPFSANKYMFFNVYFGSSRWRVRHKSWAEKPAHPSGKATDGNNAMTFPAAFALPSVFKVVARAQERAYRGGRTIVFDLQPLFEACRI